MSFRANVGDALRIATWRTPRASTARMTPLTAFGLFAMAILAVAICQFFLAGASLKTFDAYGINSIIAIATVQALVIVVFARIDPSSWTIRNLVLLQLAVSVVAVVELAILQALGLDAPNAQTSLGAAIGIMLTLPAWIIWMTGAARQVFKVAPGVRWPALRGFAFTIAIIIVPTALPDWPVVLPAHFDRTTANLWEIGSRYARAWRADEHEAENRASEARAAEMRAAQLEARQSALLSAAVDALEPRDPSSENIFVIGVAGWCYQDVFMSETQQSLGILSSHFHAGTRILSLVNNTAAENERPMASVQNIATVLRAVGARMNPDKDVLILAMTSHGSPDGFALEYGQFVERTLDPQTLKTMLDQAGIKNRILIVSSCYSGTFVAPLADPDTAIITAASATHTSFGCANERKWTYFGEAFFEKGLTGDATIADAFIAAKATIATWESEQKLMPSDPQITIGERIARRFPKLVGRTESTSTATAEAGATHAKAE